MVRMMFLSGLHADAIPLPITASVVNIFERALKSHDARKMVAKAAMLRNNEPRRPKPCIPNPKVKAQKLQVNAGVWNDYTGGVLSAAACGPMGADYQAVRIRSSSKRRSE